MTFLFEVITKELFLLKLALFFKELIIVRTSIVFPDLDIKIKSELFKFLILFNLFNWSGSRLFMKINSLLIFLKKKFIAWDPNIDPPIPIVIILLNLLYFLTQRD